MKLLLYCCKAKPYLYKTDDTMIEKMNGDYHTQLNKAVLNNNCLNGKIVAECDFEVEEILFKCNEGQALIDSKGWKGYGYKTKSLNASELYKKTGMSFSMLDDYLTTDVYCEENNKKMGYAIHIKNLHIFDKPRELEDYEDEWEYPLEKAPQNMRRCYSTLYSNIEADMPIRTDSYILISIKPEWLCKILNGEKTIEVRKKVLKEMLE